MRPTTVTIASVWAFAAAICLSSFTHAAPDARAKRALGVLPTVDGDGNIIGLMSVEGAASAAAVDAAITRGVTAETPASFRLLLEERIASGAPCVPSDASCLAAIGEEASVKHLITLVLTARDDGVFLEVGLVDVSAARFLRKDNRRLPDTSADVASAVEQQVAVILNSWRPDVPEPQPKAAPAPVPMLAPLPAPQPTTVVVTPAGTGFVDGMGLLSAALTWGGVVVGAAGGLTFLAAMVTSGAALGSYFYGGGYVQAKDRAALYPVGVYAAWVVPPAALAAVLGLALAGAGWLFFEAPEPADVGAMEEGPEA